MSAGGRSQFRANVARRLVGACSRKSGPLQVAGFAGRRKTSQKEKASKWEEGVHAGHARGHAEEEKKRSWLLGLCFFGLTWVYSGQQPGSVGLN